MDTTAPAAVLEADVETDTIPDPDPDPDEVVDHNTNDDEDDSLFDTGSISTAATSFREDMMKLREEHGRKYHGYMDAKYVLPMDEEEKNRLDFQHHLAWLSLGKKQTWAPLKTLHRALDVGCGTGLWAIDFADEHPETQVLGVDLAAVQPLFVPPNLQFEVDDLEKEWNFSRRFNYVHSQLMIGAFQDWPKFIGQSFEFLEPGGYFEIHDIDFVIRCDDDTLPADSDLVRWHSLMHEGANAAGFPLDAIPKVPQMMADAGFENVVAVPIKWPINPWPKDKRAKEVGMWAMENFTWGCQSMSLALFTRALGWTAEEVMAFMGHVRRDLKNRKYHAYWNFWVVYGKKPGGESSPEALP
ncbi:uncharacterized protein L3040_006864 [Drepanopeziza brunnea f. sp. 'multigermtubi']|uniref:Methyltransferase domain-containing protein n=1 Tax=Marssonina brunnea f. sp. multigermtubi (strain MB_m1) TaxID=1072389 RepID=K1W6T4_MARBU|nr:methyltransferase domain-containing protein [Drepanopeziza brunnea f. sp. 'multigermtubi' MB_m1]EKD12715.1 methyltransferase domain-containing protein [Drepanopeziza brunnea f. sp. 'multigermtubi' MB_m1]KAJ5037990.1 hypothetical protein L3040_006864 [Drepanopeziza brunnea f. sp. 'multigermtubi']